jgi:chromosome segregation ATPase
MTRQTTMLSMAQEIVKLNKSIQEKECLIASKTEKIDILTHDATEKDAKTKELANTIVGLELEKEAENNKVQSEKNELREHLFALQGKYESEVDTLNKCLQSAQQRSGEQQEAFQKETGQLKARVEVQQAQIIVYAGKVNHFEENTKDLELNNKDLSGKAQEDKNIIAELKLSLEDQRHTLSSEISAEKANSAKLEEWLKSTQLQLDESRSEVMKLAGESDERLTQVSTLQENISELESTIEALKRGKKDLKRELDKSQQKDVDLNALLFDEQRKYTSEISKWKERHEKLEQSLMAANGKLEDSQNTNLELNANAEEQNAKITDLDEHNSELETKKIDFLMAISRQKSKLEEAKTKNSDLHDRFKEEKQKFISEIRYWKEMNERLYRSINSAREKLEDSKSAKETATAMNEDMQIHITALTEQVFQLETMTSDNVFELEANNKSLERTNKKLIEKLRTVVANGDKLSDRVSELENIKETLENTVEELNGKVGEVNKENADLRTQVKYQKENCFTEMARWEERHQKLEQSFQDSQQSLEESRNANEKLATKCQIMKAKVSSLSDRVLQLETRTKYLQRENENLTDSLDGANKQYSDISGHLEDKKEKFDKELTGRKENYENILNTNKELETGLKVARKFNNMQTSRFLELELQRQANALKGIEHYNVGEARLRLVLSEDDIFVSLGEKDPQDECQEGDPNDYISGASEQDEAEEETVLFSQSSLGSTESQSYGSTESQSDGGSAMLPPQKTSSQLVHMYSVQLSSSRSAGSMTNSTASKVTDDDDESGDGGSDGANEPDTWFWNWSEH